MLHSPLQGYKSNPTVFSRCPNLSPAVPLSPYGQAHVARKVSQFGVMKIGSLVGKMPEQGMPGVHRVDHRGSQLQQMLQSIWKQSYQLSPWHKAMWVLGVLLSCGCPGPKLSWRGPIHPLAQHRSGPSQNTTGLQETERLRWPGCHPGRLATHRLYGLLPHAQLQLLTATLQVTLAWLKGRTGVLVGQSQGSRPLEPPWSTLSWDADRRGCVGCGSLLWFHCSAERQTSDGTFLSSRCTCYLRPPLRRPQESSGPDLELKTWRQEGGQGRSTVHGQWVPESLGACPLYRCTRTRDKARRGGAPKGKEWSSKASECLRYREPVPVYPSSASSWLREVLTSGTLSSLICKMDRTTPSSRALHSSVR